MHYLALQITVFLLTAIISGVAIGWWVKGMLMKIQFTDDKNQSVSDHRNLIDTREQLLTLQAKYKQAQQQIDKYSAHYNSNTYGQYLEARKSLEEARTERESLLSSLNHQKSIVQKLQHELSMGNKVVDSRIQTKDLSKLIKQTEVDVEEDDSFQPDDLKKIAGINNKMEQQLNSLGILKYRQIAEFSLQDAEMISSHLDASALPDYSFMISTAKDLHSNKHQHQAA